MELKEGIPVKFGQYEGMIYGGPYRHYKPGTRRLIGIKMAREIDHPHDVSVPTDDFSVPDVEDMQRGLIAAVQSIARGYDVYVGCMGGIGRTGLFMGCMKKCLNDYEGTIEDPVGYVRKHYRSHAIETREQKAYVRTFDSAPVVKAMQDLTQEKVITVVEYVDRPVYPRFWRWLRNLGTVFFRAR